MTDCFFFKNIEYQLFGSLHIPEKKSRNNDFGIVFCAPFAEEKLFSQRIYYNFARYLSENGFFVLRFDYMGHGDSEGNFEDADIYSRLQDIHCAIKTLKEKICVKSIGLFGLRFGATLAVLSAEQENEINFLLLWEPIVQGEQYIKQCLRTNLTYQTAIYKKIFYTRDQMIEDLMADKPANIDGYLLTRRLFQQIIEIDLADMNINFVNPVQIVHLTKNIKKNPPGNLIKFYKAYSHQNSFVDFQKVQTESFWGDTKNYCQNNDELFDLSARWLENISV